MREILDTFLGIKVPFLCPHKQLGSYNHQVNNVMRLSTALLDSIFLNGVALNTVDELTFLGSTFYNSGTCMSNVMTQVGKVSTVFLEALLNMEI